MIDKIHIKALKSIKDLTIQCARLNLFTGTNSSGKSTFLQALLLMAQKNLNGKLISIGEFHVSYNEFSAVFKLRDGTLYTCSNRKRDHKMISEISEWYESNKEELQKAWKHLHS